MAHPAWVLKQKVKNSEIRHLGNRYYLYAVTSKWCPEKQRSQKVTLGMIGTITKDGLIPKGQGRKGRPPKQKPIAEDENISISIKEFGATNFLQKLSSDILSSLKAHFPEDWQSIFVLVSDRLLYQSCLKDCVFFFEESFISETMKDANLGKRALIKLLIKLRSNIEVITNLKKEFTKEAEFDLTYKIPQSEENYNPNGTLDYASKMEKLLYTYDPFLQVDIKYMKKNQLMEAWDFINHLAAIMYCRILNLLKKRGLLEEMSPEDLLMRLKRISKIKLNNIWELTEINPKTQELIQKLGIIYK